MKKLLIVVDYQNDFVNGTLGFNGAEKLENGIVDLMKSGEFEHFIFTYDTHNETYLNTQEGKNLPVKHCIKGTKGHDLFGKVNEYQATLKNVWHFEKNTFGSIDLIRHLSIVEQYDEIHIVGLVSNICVLSNAVLAKTAQPEAKIVIHKDLTDSYDKSLNEKALDIMKGLQMEVL